MLVSGADRSRVYPAGDSRAGDVPAIRSAGNLHEMLVAQAQRDADAVAILAPGRAPLRFGTLLDQIDNIRTTLNGYGLGRGDRIALLAARGMETAVAAIGIASCAVCAPLNAAGTPAELKDGLVQTGAKALLVPSNASTELKELAQRAGVLLLEYSSEECASAGRLRIHGGRAATVARDDRVTAGDVAFIMRTSGTTARAKVVPISHRNSVARADKSCRMFSLSPADRCLNLMPLCYHHGLNTGLISPLAAGCAVICPPVFDVETFLACMREFSPTWYTASFTYHQAILEWLEQSPHALADHRLRFVRSSSGPLPARVRIGIENILGVPMLQAYGTTETGTIAANPAVGARKPETVGFSPDNDVAIMEGNGNLLSRGMEGEVVVSGATVFDGYENDPAANQRIFSHGWYRTGDQGFIDADGFVKLTGRLDEVINRGGEKIAPREVDEALLMHDAVTQAISFPIPHTTLHQDIATAFVPRSGANVTGDELRSFLAARLAPFKVPRVILSVAELPKGPTGKLGRKDMAAHFGLHTAATSDAPALPPTKIQEILLALWRDVLKRQDIGCDDDFFLAGGDSLSAVDLLHRIEVELQYQLPVTILMEAPTVSKLEDRLEKGSLGAISNVVRIQTRGTQPPLFAAFGRYGHVLRLIPLLRSLGSDLPCYGLQPPGMDWSSTGCTTLPEMAAHYIGEVKGVQPHGPYRLLGVSFGGLVVFEMALQLQRMGEVVESLVLVDTAPPNCLLHEGADLAPSWVIEDVPPRNAIEAVNRQVAQTHLHARRNHVLDGRLAENLFRGDLTYFYCQGNPVAAGHDRRRLWQRFISGRFRLLPLPGSHGDVDKEPQFTTLRNVLSAVYRGEAISESDPASVFDRSYRIENCDQRECIIASTGDVYHIEQRPIQGCVVAINTDAQTIRFQGWAVEPCQRQPAKTIAVFLDDRFLGYGASGVLRDDARKFLPAGSTKYSGFDFYFKHGGVIDAKMRPRLFVLSKDNCAVELPIAVEQKFMTWAELVNSAAESDKMRAELETMKKSISWRITEPLRQIRRVATRYLLLRGGSNRSLER